MVARNPLTLTSRNPDAGIRWLGPLPIWARPGPAGLRLQDPVRAEEPAILRFDHDEFMQEYLDTLEQDPERLGDWLAQPETWRQPMATPRRARAETATESKIAFLYDRTDRLASMQRPGRSMGLSIQPLKTALSRRKALPSVRALSDEQLPLKLFQSSQKRHYLVCASLISEEPGLPDCEPELSRREGAGFVLRRLLPPQTADGGTGDDLPVHQWDEYAFVAGQRGNSWRRLGSHKSDAVTRRLAPGEEQLPLFPVSFLNSCKERRRLLSAVIPVSRREDWVGAPIGADPAVTTGSEGQETAQSPSLASFLFQADVVAPWKLLLEQAETKKLALATDLDNFDDFDTDDQAKAKAKADDRRRLLRSSRDEIQTGSWYLLLDFAKFLKQQLSGIWRVITGEAELQTLNDKEQELVGLLSGARMSWPLAQSIVTYPYLFWLDPFGTGSPAPEDPRYGYAHVKWTLAQALVAAAASEQGLEAVENNLIRFDPDDSPLPLDDNWPDFLFPLADPLIAAPLPPVAAAEIEELVGVKIAKLSGVEKAKAALDALAKRIEALLPPGRPAEEVLDPVRAGDTREAWFVLRCVYQRPLCGPLFPPLVSAPTQKFQMAPFFDPDAPARPVRIPMPVDISPAGLRKYQKNTGLVMSDMLCGKISRIRKMTFADLVLSVLPWPFHKDLPDPSSSGPCKDGRGNGFGMICSLSIPIVTLCALILMIIMVALFDLFFRWIPYLFLCLPIPGLSGKEKG